MNSCGARANEIQLPHHASHVLWKLCQNKLDSNQLHVKQKVKVTSAGGFLNIELNLLDRY